MHYLFRLYLIPLLCFTFCEVAAQNTLRVTVRDSSTGEALTGATILLQHTTNGAATDVNGNAELANIADGNLTFEVSLIGYTKKTFNVLFPRTEVQPLKVLLAQNQSQLQEIVVTSTRTNSRIEDAPIKAEVLGQEDLTEENSIKPGNVSSILGDVSSIQIQQLSPVNNNSVVRMQGLDGKYTLLLRDGMPEYGGLSGGLSILQIPPLDLKQIEIIKGPSSTLNGGGAIAGVINFISKEPSDSNESVFTVNQSTLLETNFNAYLSGRKNSSGYTLLGSYTTQQAVDVNHDNFSDVPLLHSFLLHPRFFYDFNNALKLKLGFTALSENRTGGDMHAIASNIDSLHQFFTGTKTERQAVDIDINHTSGNKNTLSFKSTVNRFSRDEKSNLSAFNGVQWNEYSELFYSIPAKKSIILFGTNYLLDDFKKLSNDTFPVDDYMEHTFGLFAQYALTIPDKINLQAGMRSDYHSTYGWFLLPSAAVLFHAGKNFSIRLTGGTGYKTPNLLELTSNSFYENVPSLQLPSGIVAENSAGGTLEWSFKKIFANNTSLFINQTFFITQIRHSILQAYDTVADFYFNSTGPVTTKGIDNYIRISKEPYELYMGYTYTLPENPENAPPYLTYTPLHRAAFTFVIEATEDWRLGFETSYNGFQYREDGSKTSDYFFLAASVQFKTGHFTFVLNGENLLDYRQTKTEDIVRGSPANPQFKKLWAPVDGRVINFSVMLKL